MHTFIHINTYMHTYIHIYIHTCIHTYTYSYKRCHTYIGLNTVKGQKLLPPPLDLGSYGKSKGGGEQKLLSTYYS